MRSLKTLIVIAGVLAPSGGLRTSIVGHVQRYAECVGTGRAELRHGVLPAPLIPGADADAPPERTERNSRKVTLTEAGTVLLAEGQSIRRPAPGCRDRDHSDRMAGAQPFPGRRRPSRHGHAPIAGGERADL